jgi:hypothetical protein
MSKVDSINKFNESLAKLSDDINRIFSGQIPGKKYLVQLTTYVFHTFNFLHLIISSLVYDHCTNAPLLAESELLKTATGRQKYLLEAGIYLDGRFVGSELYYTIERYLTNYVTNLRQV